MFHFRSAIRSPARGFTLVEVLMVVGLLGVLILVALPSYNTYREKARQRTAASEIVGMSLSIKLRWEDERAYPASLAALKMEGRLDPWGRAYVYYNIDANGKGGARKDHALNPINTDFDLYSMGPDGKSKSQVTQKDSVDDVIRAGNGSYVGAASDF